MQRDCKDLVLEDKLKINSHAFPGFLVGVYKYTLGVKKMVVAALEGKYPPACKAHFLPHPAPGTLARPKFTKRTCLHTSTAFSSVELMA